MKKTIIALGLAVLSFTTVSAASGISPMKAKSENAIPHGATPLCVAISKGEIDIVKKFVEYGADVNEKSNGLTPLMIAATYNQVEIIQYLLSKGADARIKNDSGYTALRFAQLSKSNEAAAVLAEVK